jgi:sensor domain CHASE-containing protein
MKLRTKTILIIVAITLVVFLALQLIAGLVLLPSFSRIEVFDTKEKITQANNAISNEIADLNSKDTDWAAWDDTYNFVQGTNTDYARNNLIDATFINLRINLMVLVNSTGQIIYLEAFDLGSNVEIPVNPDTIVKILANSFMWNFSNTNSETKGVFNLSNQPMMLVSEPILTSLNKGPIMGALIMGRIIDTTKLSQTVGFPITVYRYDDPQIPKDFKIAKTSLTNNDPMFVQPLSQDYVAGYSLMNDVSSNPGIIIRIETQRDFYTQGLATTNFFIELALSLCIIFGTAMMLLLEKGILNPIQRLTAAVKEMATTSGDSYPTITIEKNEIKLLSEAMKNAISLRLAAIEELAGMVGHDLRNPLTGIAGATYYVRKNYGSEMDAKGQAMLKVIEDDVSYSNK